MEIRTWRSAIADLETPPPGAPLGALGEGNPGWVGRCDAAISRYKEKTFLFGRSFTCSQNIKMAPFSLMPDVRQASAQEAGSWKAARGKRTETAMHIPPWWWNMMTCWPFSRAFMRAFVVSFEFRRVSEFPGIPSKTQAK